MILTIQYLPSAGSGRYFAIRYFYKKNKKERRKTNHAFGKEKSQGEIIFLMDSFIPADDF